nr:hypothetical protein [Riemerella anatipestifer]
MSTFKFPIALTILHKVENGELLMQQQIFIKRRIAGKYLESI